LEETGHAFEFRVGYCPHMHYHPDVKLLNPIVFVLQAKWRPFLLVFGENAFAAEFLFDESLIILRIVLPEV
jgi:hypothetical protein